MIMILKWDVFRVFPSYLLLMTCGVYILYGDNTLLAEIGKTVFRVRIIEKFEGYVNIPISILFAE